MTGRVLSPAEADRRFFERFPHRSHRIRVASINETVAARRRGALTMDPPDNFRPFIGIRSEGVGRLHYAIGHLRDDCDTDMAEGDAGSCFELLLRQRSTQRRAIPQQHQPEHSPRPSPRAA